MKRNIHTLSSSFKRLEWRVVKRSPLNGSTLDKPLSAFQGSPSKCTIHRIRLFLANYRLHNNWHMCECRSERGGKWDFQHFNPSKHIALRIFHPSCCFSRTDDDPPLNVCILTLLHTLYTICFLCEIDILQLNACSLLHVY